MTKFYCPRRDDTTRWFASAAGGGVTFYLDPAVQIGRTPLEDEWRSDDTCSYCGSQKPETLIAYIEKGGVVGPTDKGYKLYLDDLSKLGFKGARGADKFYLQHIAHPCPERARLYDLVMDGKVAIGYPGHFYSGLLGIRKEHIARHPELMTDAERAALDAFRDRNPGVAVP